MQQVERQETQPITKDHGWGQGATKPSDKKESIQELK